MANTHMKKYSTSLATQEMQVKTTLSFHLTSVKMAIINNTTTNAGKGVDTEVPQKIKNRTTI
jgi:hypothetical protein